MPMLNDPSLLARRRINAYIYESLCEAEKVVKDPDNYSVFRREFLRLTNDLIRDLNQNFRESRVSYSLSRAELEALVKSAKGGTTDAG